jgi:succinyl-diaminopimelate desuccinylase
MFDESIITKYRDEMLGHISDLIAIPSVESSQQDGMPFGKEVDDALRYALNLAASFGFTTCNLDGYAGYAEWGEGSETLGILVHVDIVPEGSGWIRDPFHAVLEDGWLYGRGAADNKGPAISVLYALRILKEAGIKTRRKIRIIFGTNEETGWKDMAYYLESEPAPDIAFTPDGDFPAVYAEKGIYSFELIKQIPGDSPVIGIKGGTSVNSVADNCVVQLAYTDEVNDIIENPAEPSRYTVDRKQDHAVLTYRGISAHASVPELGENAICRALSDLKTLLPTEIPIAQTISALDKWIGLTGNGRKMKCFYADEESGCLTANWGRINFQEGRFSVCFDLRYPVTQKKTEIIEVLNQFCQNEGFTLQVLMDMAPIYMDKESELIAQLMRAYKKVTGQHDAAPVSMAGATYARAMKNTVAFGGVFPDESDTSHQPDERLGVENLMTMTLIYAKAIQYLAGDQNIENL